MRADGLDIEELLDYLMQPFRLKFELQKSKMTELLWKLSLISNGIDNDPVLSLTRVRPVRQ